MRISSSEAIRAFFFHFRYFKLFTAILCNSVARVLFYVCKYATAKINEAYRENNSGIINWSV